MVPDGRHFVSRARDESLSWRRIYKEPIPVSSIADRMGGYAQAYTLYSSVRPFGITAIIGGADENGPALYMVEPSGLYWVRPYHTSSTRDIYYIDMPPVSYNIGLT